MDETCLVGTEDQVRTVSDEDTPPAIVICGGFGTRLGPAMGEARCKSLVAILGTPALAYVLKALRHANCPLAILSVDRPDISPQIQEIGNASGLTYLIHHDSGRGPTYVTHEASSLVSSSRLLVLYGHQIIFPDHLQRMIASNENFVATTYPESSEGVRKVATVNSDGYCVTLRYGSQSAPAQRHEVYLDKPYLLQTKAVRNAIENTYDPLTPATEDLRPHTVLRYARCLYAIRASFRHEFHYPDEMHEVTLQAHEFNGRFGAPQ